VSDGGPPRFFHEAESAPGDTLELDGDEAEHGAQSLRLRPGDTIELVDGKGHVATAQVTGSHRRRLTVSILARSFESPPDRPRLILGLGLLKGPRFDLALEKLTELGVDVVIPLLTHYSEVPLPGKTKSGRWHRILVSAMKQSRRTWLPELREPVRLADMLAAEKPDLLLVAHPALPDGTPAPTYAAPAARLPTAPPAPAPTSPAGPARRTELLLVGPEGGWAPEELRLVTKAGASFISLGPNRLRAETAAMALLSWRLSALGWMGAGPISVDRAGSSGMTS